MRRYENVKIDKLIPYENNARTHSDEQIEKIAKSIKEFGFINPVLIDADFGIIAGHGRVLGAQKIGLQEVPCIFIDDLTEDQKRAYIIADNKLAEDAGWDNEILISELEALKNMDFDISLTGFDSLDEIEIDIDGKQEVEEDDFDCTPPEEPTTKIGDIYQLGDHRLICGDSTDAATIKKLMDGQNADLVFTDPPYGVGFESKGVLNDNQNDNELVDFNKKWIPLSFDALKENGSWYCWGVDTSLMDIYGFILRPMIKQNKITFRNLLTWDKGLGQNQNDANMRSYPAADEKCLFVMCGVQGFNNNADHYDETFEPIRAYMEQEAKKAGLTPKKLTEITGVQMYGHWFTKSQFCIIPENRYKQLQDYYKGEAFTMDWQELNKLSRKEAIMAKRAYFDNTHDNMNNVWHFTRTDKQERELTGGHATPKPIALCSRAIKSSSREGETVLDFFGGSGSTLIACEQLNRRCYMAELDPKYCDVIINRWETYTGKKAIKIK